MEKRGSGFDKISNDYYCYGEKYAPYITSLGESFTLTLPNVTYKNGIVSSDELPDIYTEGLLTGKNFEKILSFCYNGPKTITEIAKKLNIKPSTYFRNDVIGKLVLDKYLLVSEENRKKKYTSNRNKVFIK